MYSYYGIKAKNCIVFLTDSTTYTW